MLAREIMWSSPEEEIGREIESLIRKLANGTADDGDRSRLHDLQKQRVELMKPRTPRERREQVG